MANNGGICTDIVHEWFGEDISNHNHMGDVFLFLNISLFLIMLGTNTANNAITMRVILIYVVLSIVLLKKNARKSLNY